ncbi:phospholipase A2 [Lentzea sp. JNUCC 0626]|uniref:phospholipase A2 n=1 Tax=Lentzea sp. JNUCC 0626 TaxID=3367513 RepID=UPI0037485B5F
MVDGNGFCPVDSEYKGTRPSPHPEELATSKTQFKPACDRHDFGYRNYKRQNRWNESNPLRIDRGGPHSSSTGPPPRIR